MTERHRSRTFIVVLASLLMFSAAAGAVGATDAASNATQANDAVPLEDGGTYWQGQQLSRSGGVDAGETLEIREQTADGEAGTLVRQVSDGDDDGTVVFDTASIQGEYVLEDSDNNVVAGFEVAKQTLATSWGSNRVKRSGSATTADLTIDSNRGEFAVVISAGDLSEDDLLGIFSDATAGSEADDGKIQIAGITGQDTLTGDFQDIDTGTYEFKVSAADTTATASASIEVVTAAGISASFEQSNVQQERGDIVEFAVNLQNTQTATVSVGSEAINYLVDLSITDGDSDGTVEIRMNTFQAGGWTGASEDQAFSVVDGADDISVTRATDALQQPLATGNYELSISVSDDEEAVGTLFVVSRATDSLSVLTAPRANSMGSLDSVTDSTVQDSSVAKDDWLVLRVQASGVFGYLQSVDDLGQNGLSVTIEQTNPGANQEPTTIEAGAGRLITDPANNEFYLVLSTDADEIKAGQQYEATFEIDGDDNPYVESGETETASGTFEIEDASARINLNDGDQIVLESTAEATVSGTTTVAAGTGLDVRIRGTSANNPFLKDTSVTVSQDGTWSATLNLSDVPEDAPFEIRILQSGRQIGSAEGVIGEQPGPSTQTPSQPETVIKTVVKTKVKTPEEPRTVIRTVVKTQEETRTVVKTVFKTREDTIAPGLDGFGILVALLALLATALIALRRR